jgi:hypothetical protein
MVEGRELLLTGSPKVVLDGSTSFFCSLRRAVMTSTFRGCSAPYRRPMSQSRISIFTAVKESPPLRVYPATIRTKIEGRGVHGHFRLANIGCSLAKARAATTANFGIRNKCDSCLFVQKYACTGKDHSCETCLKLYGRPFCSWTPDVPSIEQNTFEDLQSAGDTANVLRRKALFGLPGWQGDETLAADPVIREVDQEDEPSVMDD